MEGVDLNLGTRPTTLGSANVSYPMAWSYLRIVCARPKTTYWVEEPFAENDITGLTNEPGAKLNVTRELTVRRHSCTSRFLFRCECPSASGTLRVCRTGPTHYSRQSTSRRARNGI
jgi:hypothetical protein